MASDLPASVEQPLLQTKISVPLISSGFVHRPRLTELIDRGVQGPLTLLIAPAGYGKTSLLIEWTEQTDLPVAWLSLEHEDNDPSRFFRYLIGALQTLEPGLGAEALDFVRITRGSGIETALTLLINELSVRPEEMVLVLDDFQAVEETTVLGAISFLLKHLPHNLHVVIASRNEPALGLASLRTKGQMPELRPDDLRFTSDEVSLFLRQAMGLALASESVMALEQRTGGWITALQMAAISLRGQSDATALLANLQGTAHYLIDYLAEEVLDRQPEEIRQFLLSSAVLERLTGSLCEAVVRPGAQPGYGQAMLNRLERASLFIVALDEKREWFQYYHLFADFLRHVQAQTNPAGLSVLHQRAALWFEQRANLGEAFRHALASGDAAWTAELIERNVETMIKTGELFELTRWLGELPAEVIRQRPRLALAYAWGAIAAHRLDDAQYWVEDVQRSLEQREQTAAASGQETDQDRDVGVWNVQGVLAVCRSALALLNGDWEKAAELSKQATGYLGEESPFFSSLLALDDSYYIVLSGDTAKAVASLRNTAQIALRANNVAVLIIATCQIAETQILQGQLALAWATLEKAQSMSHGAEEGLAPLAGLVDVGFGEILLERGSLEEAKTYLERGCQGSRSRWSINALESLVSLARLHQARGDVVSAQAAIAEAAGLTYGMEAGQWDAAFVSAAATHLALQRDDLAAAEQWWKRGQFPAISETVALEDFPYHMLEHVLLTQARFLLVRGQDSGSAQDLQRAAGLLATLLPEAERLQRAIPRIEILILQSLVQDALEDDRATATLRRALELGETAGCRQIFIDEGPRLSGLLRRCQEARPEPGHYLPSPAFIEDLLTAIGHTDSASQIAHRSAARPAGPAGVRSEEGFPILLSARELEVLVLIAQGKSNQEIAVELYLALNTVKRHAYNIYAKLEVTKRTEAVFKARRLGLIS